MKKTIPDCVLRHYYNSINNVNISIEKISNKNLSIVINDTNELPYKFDDEYVLYKKNDKRSNNLEKNYSKFYDETESGTTKIEYDWTDKYNELEKGEYALTFSTIDEIINWQFEIDFEIDENGKVINYNVSYNKC